VSKGQKVGFKIVVTLMATAVSFVLGALAGGTACERWVIPGWVKQYPHDGQLGLGVFMYEVLGGLAAALIVLVAGIVWTVQELRRRENPDRQLPTASVVFAGLL
jgi:hypothetical protein